ncbi:ABC transporter ATP-binding protein (plasmid) [Aliirhizobium terrae]|uniref:ABC transporter ATP-binding protein n=1 Tax=Terrirhizobium terrae TaxID=2926709 RepID=UPI002575DCDC|nr:ABC transporter ATP-binding protein [Rhizobium sp. CC-CFT758]WJH38095.1 ABC transporter ATP-binding protein [Rhizobium sp. CC-CFT758]
MPAETLEVRNLSAGYGPTHIIEGLSFSLEAGRKLAILGRNGMGKTTLLATLAGQTRRYCGTIRIGKQDITERSSAARANTGLGYVPQTRDVFPSLSVEENLLVGLKDRPREAISEAYDMFPRLKERRKNLGSQLSGGEQQMLSTARSILGQPSVLLLDEPLEGLAPVICEELMAALSRLADGRLMTIVLVEQRIQSALDFADQVIILERGRLAWQGAPAALAHEQDTINRLLGIGYL